MQIRFAFDLSQTEAYSGRRKFSEFYYLSLIENLETAKHLKRCDRLSRPKAYDPREKVCIHNGYAVSEHIPDRLISIAVLL